MQQSPQHFVRSVLFTESMVSDPLYDTVDFKLNFKSFRHYEAKSSELEAHSSLAFLRIAPA
jgi:hypothetical protein